MRYISFSYSTIFRIHWQLPKSRFVIANLCWHMAKFVFWLNFVEFWITTPLNVSHLFQILFSSRECENWRISFKLWFWFLHSSSNALWIWRKKKNKQIKRNPYIEWEKGKKFKKTLVFQHDQTYFFDPLDKRRKNNINEPS